MEQSNQNVRHFSRFSSLTPTSGVDPCSTFRLSKRISTAAPETHVLANIQDPKVSLDLTCISLLGPCYSFSE